MSAIRAGTILAGFLGLTVPLMPVQAILVRTSPRLARRFPHWYHRQVCRLLGVRLTVEGEVPRDRPVLIVSNHTSWLDIPVMSAVAPVSFIAKKEVGGWPFVSSLARLQRTVFVDRERRTATGATANEILQRLSAGDAMVLFAEGTSSDGNRVLPFRSALFAAVKPSGRDGDTVPPDAIVQTAAIVYTRLHGVPLGRFDRPHVGWYGDMEMTGHAWELLKSGPIDVTVRLGPALPLETFADRKELAAGTETRVRESLVRALRRPNEDEPVDVVRPSDEQRKSRPPRAVESGNWR
jgi:1-acyl-sn-glycerol-3-phosphate acyltransferase